MISVFEHPWLHGLFGDAETSVLWSPEAQLNHYRAFEAAFARALVATGRVSNEQGQAAVKIIETAETDIESLARGTGSDGLPIPDFVRQLRISAGDAAEAIHTGATSQDVLDTALVLTLKGCSDLFCARLASLDVTLRELLERRGDAPMMGRTRMQAALPIHASDRITSWRQPLLTHANALTHLRPSVERLQLGGAVGTREAFGKHSSEIVRHMTQDLGLHEGSVWHTDRTSLAEYASRMSLITGNLGKMGQDITLMAQQGVDEITLAGGGGSSAMPHKSNPVLAELLVTLARFNATQLSGIHQSLVHEQERSGAAWMLEWMILPQMTIATARALSAAQVLCRQIQHIGEKEID